MSRESTIAVAVDGGELSLGGGLLAIVRPALALLKPGGTLAVNSRSRSLPDDLARWCRIERHEYLGSEPIDEQTQRHLIARGRDRLRGPRENLALGEPPFSSEQIVEAVPLPERTEPDTGFAPRGAQVEQGGPRYPFSLLERDHVAPPEIGRFYDQAVAAQWNAERDIPWNKLRPLPAEIQLALSQVMTFLAENELSALYVPSRFVPRIHPAYAEVAMFLSTQMADEARHIDVFLKRARAGGPGLGISSVTTARSLLSLLEVEDFTEAAFLLSVLGEGTFLDLLKFIEDHAPDDVTAEVVHRARQDETRHVHFGLAHVEHALTCEQSLYDRLENAVRRRAASLGGMGGVPPLLQDGLTILAAGSTRPADVSRGHDAFRELLDTMHENRIKRLKHAGFSADQAENLSALHTPNFM